MTENANGKTVTTGYNGSGTYSATADYDLTSDYTYPHRDHTAVAVSAETITYGTTDGVINATTFNGIYENVTEENLVNGGEANPSTKGPEDDTGENEHEAHNEDADHR